MYLNKLFNLNGKVAAVTGAGGHLCGEMVKAYARVGCKVAILDLRLEKAKKIEKEINEEGFMDTISLEIDVSDKSNFESVRSCFQNVFRSFDRGSKTLGPWPKLRNGNFFIFHIYYVVILFGIT